MKTVKPRNGGKGKVVMDHEFYNRIIGSSLHQLSMFRYMRSKYYLQLHLYHELFPAKIFMMALSQVGVGLHFCLKDLVSPKLFSLKTEVELLAT